MKPLRALLPQGPWRILNPDDKAANGPRWTAYLTAYTICLAIGVSSLLHFGELFIWPSTGVMVAGLLLLPRKDAVKLAVCGTIFNFFGVHFTIDNFAICLLYVLLDLVEVIIAVALARRYCGAAIELTSNAPLGAFIAFAALPAALFRGVTDSLTYPTIHAEPLINIATFLMTDIFAMAVLVPLILGSVRTSAPHTRTRLSAMGDFALFCLSIGMVMIVFMQTSFPFVFVTMLPLIWVAFRFSQVEAIWTSVIVVAIAYYTSMSGHGPIAFEQQHHPHSDDILGYLSNDIFLMHLYAVSLIAIVLPINSMMQDDRRLKARLFAKGKTVARALYRTSNAERLARHLAEHDVETGLPNREKLIATTAELMAGRNDIYIAVFTINRFAELRSSIGQTLIAEIVKIAASRIADFPEVKMVARLSQAKLGVVLATPNQSDAFDLINRISKSFDEHIFIQSIGVDIRLTAGLGAGQNARALVHNAQTAVDQAHNSEKPVMVYSAEMEREANFRLTLLSDLHYGLDNGQVWVSYQPKLNLHTGELYCAEALIRWNHPTLGPIGPDKFIPIAEETGFIDPLTKWIVERVVADHLSLLKLGLPANIAINISAHSIWDIEFAKEILAIVTGAGANPRYFTLEITETGIMKRSGDSFRTLAMLKSMGFNISIDDYGSGQSSLRYLKSLPATELKIDYAFVTNLATDPKDALLVRSTIELAHGLGLNVVAEGVEDEAALAKLRIFGCDVAQGYHIARPMSLDKLIHHYRINARQMVA